MPRRLALLLGVQALGSALWIGSWWLLGRMSMTGRLDLGWLLAWLLLLLSTVPCRLALTAVGGSFAIRAGALLKRRLLLGALALDHDEARRSGIGQLYGRVLESQVIELMGLAGGFLGLVGRPGAGPGRPRARRRRGRLAPRRLAPGLGARGPGARAALLPIPAPVDRGPAEHDE